MFRKGIVGLVVVVAVVGIGTFLLQSSHALSPNSTASKPAVSLLKPYPLGTAPYQYIAYSSSLNDTRQASGVTQFFAAFILAADQPAAACTPAWGGSDTSMLTSQRSSDIVADFTNVRAAGGQVTVSLGGENGTELAVSCPSTVELTAAYKKVIDTYSLTQIDFDIEGPTLSDSAANTRRAEAISNIERMYPNLKVWLTLPVAAKGLPLTATAVIRQLNDHKVAVSGINIMAMNYNVGAVDMASQATTAAQATFGQLRQLYPNSSAAAIWQGMGITVMAGKNNTAPEVFTLANAKTVHDFAVSKGVGMLSLWNAGRDVACPDNPDGSASDPAAPASTSCSGVAQQPYDFTKALLLKKS